MADHPTVTLIRKLHERTTAGRLRWEETADSSVFQAAFPDYAVQISERGEDYYLRIFDSEGGLIDDIGDVELGSLIGNPREALVILRETFTNARRSAKGLDRAVRSILDALGQDDNDEDDDIPP
ncbi:MAG TPA: hypothetical protein VFE33_32050 [Thermoanaerobaculia bacterium]|nr:hypothetical protein [Thermoanaerobaculia bacterium]